MTDLDTGAGGIPADFLGVEAMCPSGLARLALRFQCSIMPIVKIRERPGVVTMYVEDEIHPHESESEADTARALTRAVNAAFEPWIMSYPEQYNWLHPRWLSRPGERTLDVRACDEELWRERSGPFPELPDRVHSLLLDRQDAS